MTLLTQADRQLSAQLQTWAISLNIVQRGDIQVAEHLT
jgi:hypothetical protein